MSLSRSKPLRANPRSKGARGERAVIDILKAHGWKGAYRNFGSGAFGGGDILNGPAGVSLEVKHRERCCIWDWIAQAHGDAQPTDIPVVVMRDNKHPVWWAVAPKDEVDALLELEKRSQYVVVRRQQTTHLWKWIDTAVRDAPVASDPLLGSPLACVEFTREGEDVWKALVFETLLTLLRVREAGA